MISVPDIFAAAIALGLVVGLIVVLVLQVLTSMRVQRLTYPVYEYAESKAHAQADRIVNDAKEKARSLITEAQNHASALIEKQEADVTERSRAYQDSLQALETSAHTALGESAKNAQTEQAALFSSVAEEVRGQADEMKHKFGALETSLNEMLEHTKAQDVNMARAFEANSANAAAELARTLQEASAEGKKRLEAHIETIFKQAQDEVESYREVRKRIVDTHLAEIVAETARVVLRTSLTADDHAELVRRSLEEARAAGAL